MYRRYDSYEYNRRSTCVRSDPKVMQISLKDSDKQKKQLSNKTLDKLQAPLNLPKCLGYRSHWKEISLFLENGPMISGRWICCFKPTQYVKLTSFIALGEAIERTLAQEWIDS